METGGRGDSDRIPCRSDRIPLLLIHGAWLSARSWENFADYFEKRGFAVSAPEWPRKEGDVEQLREDAESLCPASKLTLL